MRPVVPEIRALGGELVAIGSGTIQHLGWFLEDQKPDYPVYTDPGVAVFAAAEMKRGALEVFGPRSLIAGVRALAAGHRQPGVKGDPSQNGGVMIVLPDGSIPWKHLSAYAGDHPPGERILAELRRAVGR